jgi:hypothetical protein
MEMDRGGTQVFSGQAAGSPPAPPPPASPPPAPSKPALAATSQPSTGPRDTFEPPAARRAGVASRHQVANALVMLLIVLVAVALVLYFTLR